MRSGSVTCLHASVTCRTSEAQNLQVQVVKVIFIRLSTKLFVSFMRHLLRSNCLDPVLSTLLDSGDTELEKSDPIVILMEFTFCGERHIINVW